MSFSFPKNDELGFKHSGGPGTIRVDGKQVLESIVQNCCAITIDMGRQ